MTRRRSLGITVVLVAASACASAHAASAPDAGHAFEPPALPAALYSISPPSANPDRQVRKIAAADGVSLHTDTWLPVAKDGNAPPARLPVVVVYTPYSTKSTPDHNARIIDTLVPRGYAVTFAHVRGSGASEGCIEQTADHEVDDGARIVEDAGERAPWASGAVGMYGLSYPGGTMLATATGPDRRRIQSLKALVMGAPTASRYHFLFQDGVPHLAMSPAAAVFVPLFLAHPSDSPEHLPQRFGCQGEVLFGQSDMSGDYTPFWEARDHVRNLSRLQAPVLMWHGTAEMQVGGLMQSGLFDALPDGVPFKGLFGVFNHSFPDDVGFNEREGTEPHLDWERADWQAMLFAWYERYMRDVKNGVERWPTAQVQGTDGQWRTASSWPYVPGPAASLALGPDGLLGASAPSGATTYTETPNLERLNESDPDGTVAILQTPPLTERLQLIGTPELDLWLVLQQPDSHVTARLEAVHPDGKRVTYKSRTVAARSAQHLEPFVGGRFLQKEARPAPVGTPFKMTLRFNAIDLAVPAGARLRLTLAGSTIINNGADQGYLGAGVVIAGPTQPSGVVQTVQVLHSCTHRSLLRFNVPEKSSKLLDVRERDQTGPLGRDPGAKAPSADGGGLATAPSCGAPAARPEAVKPPRFKAVASMPSTRRCITGRRLRIRLRHALDARIKSASVSINGRRVATLRGHRVTRNLDLRTPSRGRVRRPGRRHARRRTDRARHTGVPGLPRGYPPLAIAPSTTTPTGPMARTPRSRWPIAPVIASAGGSPRPHRTAARCSALTDSRPSSSLSKLGPAGRPCDATKICCSP